MRKDVREFIRRLEAVGLTVEPTPGHYRVLRDGKPLRKANGMPFTLPFSPDTIRWRRAAIVELRKLGIDLSQRGPAYARGHSLSAALPTTDRFRLRRAPLICCGCRWARAVTPSVGTGASSSGSQRWHARRDRCDLYHAALEVQVAEGRFVIEQAPAWSEQSERGVVAEGAVGARAAGRLRLFRYEVRCWRDGVIPDVAEAVESPKRLSDDPDHARHSSSSCPGADSRVGP